MDIGEQRRTIYIEPIEEPNALPVEEPVPAGEPQPAQLPEQEPSRSS
jgi:hypothetical protein